MTVNLVSKRQPRDEKKIFFDKTIRPLSERKGIWLRDYLADNNYRNFSQLPSTNIQEGLIIELSRFDDFEAITEKHLSIMRHDLVPEEKFQWLINSTRAQLYIYKLLHDFDFNEEFTYDAGRYGNDLMNRIFSMIDFAVYKADSRPFHLDSKVQLLVRLEKTWETLIKYENYSKWLNEIDTNKITWVANYLVSNRIYLDDISKIYNNNEAVATILASLDCIDLLWVDNEGNIGRPSHSKILIIDRMKRAWSQQKYRDAGKTKKPYHLPLTKQTQARLEKMSKVKNLSQTEMLDILINSAYNLEFIDVNGNELF